MCPHSDYRPGRPVVTTIFMAKKVCSGYPIKMDPPVVCGYLPSNLSIRDHAEFAFSNWISYDYLGYYPYREPFNPRRKAMKLSKAAKIWIDYHKTHSKKKIRCEPIRPSSNGLSRNLVMAPSSKSPRNRSLHS